LNWLRNIIQKNYTSGNIIHFNFPGYNFAICDKLNSGSGSVYS
jgi:hypothetical protein